VPFLVWQETHGWPVIEFMRNARERKNVSLSAWQFLFEQFLLMGPLSAPIWLSGLAFLLGAGSIKAFRPVGFAYLVLVLTFIGSGNAKPYYLAPAYAPLFAGGGVFLERMTAWPRGWIVRAAALALVAGGGLITLPLAKPLLSEDQYVRYAAALRMRPSVDERHAMGRLPQFFADMHGWPELAETSASVFLSLSAHDKATACLFAQNYGEAGAIDLFGPRYGLPKAISSHNSYWIWGPGTCRVEVMVIIGGNRARLESQFETVELGAIHTCKDCMPYENNMPIWIARGLRIPIGELWPTLRNFI
jgi:hypothetical protein